MNILDKFDCLSFSSKYKLLEFEFLSNMDEDNKSKKKTSNSDAASKNSKENLETVTIVDKEGKELKDLAS